MISKLKIALLIATGISVYFGFENALYITLFWGVIPPLIWITYYVAKHKPSKYNLVYNNGIDLDAMNPEEFQQSMANIFKHSGYDVEELPFIGDFGADFVVNAEKGRIVVQCKKYAIKHLVGAREVRETIGAMPMYKAKRSILITTSGFTESAMVQARNSPIALWGRDVLRDVLKTKSLNRYLVAV